MAGAPASRKRSLVRNHGALPPLGAQIPDPARIIAYRNVFILGYASVDDRLVWTSVDEERPKPLATLTRMLEHADK